MNKQDNKIEAMEGVMMTFRPDWLNDANRVFINQLNEVCTKYKGVFADVKHIKSNLLGKYQTDIADLQAKSKELTESLTYTKTKMTSMEQNLSTIVREVVNYYFD